ncbi:MAG: sugar ABC transporter permease, partial [Thermoanaerobaculia bacterium]|nr:sugar ABC transporter permease [Thermoanaerobaculia bacterium]
MGDQTYGLLLASPALAFLLSVAIYPILRIAWMSFFTQNLGTELEPQFAGFLNYVRVASDGHFFRTLGTTALFTFCAVTVELLLGMVFALLLNERFRGRSLARASALVPWALPTAVLALAWVWVFNDQFGVLNDILIRLGIIEERIAWLGTGPTALFSVIVADVWKTTPFMMIILLAGLQAIPRELYEAAAIDGAGSWRSFTLVTLPLLVPSILLALLFRTLHSFGIFDLIYVMTGG